MAEASVDAIVTDPPYDLLTTSRNGSRRINNPDTPAGRTARGFMGKTWDGTGVAFDSQTWAEALRVLKPGGHLLSFGGTRTFHRMTCAIEDAGFEVRDCLMWLYGSGFPKSLDVSKAMDKAAGAEREVVRQVKRTGKSAGTYGAFAGNNVETSCATDLAKQWAGWGTALKPAWEPVILARKPLIGTVVANVTEHGTGALNIDGSRIGTDGEVVHAPQSDPTKRKGTVGTDLGITRADVADFQQAQRESIERTNTLGRWPANVLLDEDSAAMLDAASGVTTSGAAGRRGASGFVDGYKSGDYTVPYGDTGGASRFFYTAKASRTERNGSTHPTVKPVDLMRYLCRLVTPRGGLVLDPFAGSGTTGQAALAEGFRCILIEREAEYVAGIKTWRANMQLGMGL